MIHAAAWASSEPAVVRAASARTASRLRLAMTLTGGGEVAGGGGAGGGPGGEGGGAEALEVLLELALHARDSDKESDGIRRGCR